MWQMNSNFPAANTGTDLLYDNDAALIAGTGSAGAMLAGERHHQLRAVF
jgi:hypothetical protein